MTRVSLPPGFIDATPGLRTVWEALDGEGHETRVVGGAVRNALLGMPATDIDLATTSLPQDTLLRARDAGLKAVPTGLEHGTVTVVVAGRPFEVTTLREDIQTDGRHAIVRFGRDFRADALRRDFTINALSARRDGVVHDDVGGLDDLAAQRVQFIGEPEARIREDYLRILRFYRFHARYAGGPPDVAARRAIARLRGGLDMLSRERVRAELLKLLTADRAAATLADMADDGILERVTGGVATLLRLEGAGPRAIDRLAAIAVETGEDAARLSRLLRLSSRESDALAAYAAVRPIVRGRVGTFDVIALRRIALDHPADALARTVRIEAVSTALDAATVARVDEAVAALLATPDFPLTGHDALAAGIAPGPDVGRWLRQAREAWIDTGCLPAPTGDALSPR